MNATITAHGASYTTKAAAEARIAELNEENLVLGASDGRVTEILCIMEALQEAGLESTPAKDAEQTKRILDRVYPKRPALNPALVEFVIASEARIAYLTRNKNADDMKWRYLKFQDEAGRVTRRTYKTELGFEKAYVRAARAGMDILIAE